MPDLSPLMPLKQHGDPDIQETPEQRLERLLALLEQVLLRSGAGSGPAESLGPGPHGVPPIATGLPGSPEAPGMPGDMPIGRASAPEMTPDEEDELRRRLIARRLSVRSGGRAGGLRGAPPGGAP